MKENSIKTIDKVKERFIMLMVRLTMENGRQTKEMDKDHTLSRAELSMTVISRMTKCMDKAHSNGVLEQSTTVIGETTARMEKVK